MFSRELVNYTSFVKAGCEFKPIKAGLIHRASLFILLGIVLKQRKISKKKKAGFWSPSHWKNDQGLLYLEVKSHDIQDDAIICSLSFDKLPLMHSYDESIC